MNNRILQTYFLPFALSLPFLSMGVWVIWLFISLSAGKEAVLPVSGYDPRDLISGHYLTFTVDYPGGNTCSEENYEEEEKSCYCITSLGKNSEVTEGYFTPYCTEDNSCIMFIKGTCRYGTFDAGISRFFINETQAAALDEKLRENGAFIRLSVDYSGHALIKEFLWQFPADAENRQIQE